MEIKLLNRLRSDFWLAVFLGYLAFLIVGYLYSFNPVFK